MDIDYSDFLLNFHIFNFYAMQDQPSAIFDVRIYEPVVTEWKTVLSVPAQSQKEANGMVAEIHAAKGKFPDGWVKEEYLVEGTERIPNIHGNEYWSVEDNEGDFPDLNIFPDMSGQRAFIWSQFVGPLPSDGKERWIGPVVIDEVGYATTRGEINGVLIAEPCSPPLDIHPHMPKLRLTDIQTGLEFWNIRDQRKYRVIFVFTNPA